MELVLNELSMTGQFQSYDEFEDYFVNSFNEVLEIIEQKNIVLYKLSSLHSRPLVGKLTLIQILQESRNKAAMAILKKRILQLMANPYLDDEQTLTDAVSSYEYPGKCDEPNAFTEAIERESPLLSFRHKEYGKELFVCRKNGLEVLLINIRDKKDLLERYLKECPKDFRYVTEHYPFSTQIVFAEVHGRCYAEQAILENKLMDLDIQKIFENIPNLLDDLRNGRKTRFWDFFENEEFFEYRVTVKAGEFRLLFYQNEKIYFLNGFLKKTGKTPVQQKLIAKGIIKNLKDAEKMQKK